MSTTDVSLPSFLITDKKRKTSTTIPPVSKLLGNERQMMMDRWRQCSLVSFICLVFVGLYQQEELLFAFKSSFHWKSNNNRNLTWREMLPLFSQRDSSACKTYYEFGGVINRLSSLTFLDGQKSVCLDPGVAPTPDKCVVYSFGNNGEWSFDEQIESYGCDVYVFDPSVWYWKHRHSKKILFYHVGIGEKDDQRNERGWKIMTLTSLRQMLNHTDTIIDYLKMDIEGGEWPVLDRWLNDGDLSRVKQLAMEIHLENAETIPGKYHLIQRLEASGFVRFFSRENPYTINSYLDKYNVSGASCLELAWYNTKFVQ